MIKQEKNYISKQKKKYLTHTLIWTAAVLMIFMTGIIVTGGRANYFTLFAGLLVVGLAINLSRWMAHLPYKDGEIEYATYLEQIKGNLCIFHSGMIPDTRGTLLIEHIIVTGNRIYFLSYSEQLLKKHRLWLENRLMAKGITLNALHFETVGTMDGVKKIAKAIEKDAKGSKTQLDENVKIIEELLM